MNHRRQFSAQFKARVAREALKKPKAPSRAEEQKTIFSTPLETFGAELAAEYDVHPNQIAQWKKQMLNALPDIFSRGRGSLRLLFFFSFCVPLRAAPKIRKDVT